MEVGNTAMKPQGRDCLYCVKKTPLIVALFLLGASHYAFSQAIIIDHTCTDLSSVPAKYISDARSNFRVGYFHTSHGSQITTGMSLMNTPPYTYNADGSGGSLSYQEDDSVDLGGDWVAMTRALLDSGSDRNLILWSWCGQVSGSTPGDIEAYLNSMSQLEADYPSVRFVYMTGHLDGMGASGNLNLRNNQIRAFCAANGKLLFDFADIESYDPDGRSFLGLGANDNCDYTGGNWASEWCAAHPGSELCAECDCAHSQPLTCNLKGRAFWRMLAARAGWNGEAPIPTPTSTPPPAPPSSHAIPLTLHTNKSSFSTRDTLIITADARATSRFTPYIRCAAPGGAYYYIRSGGQLSEGTAGNGTPFLKGPVTLGSDLTGYEIATLSFSGVAPGSYAVQGAFVGESGVIAGISETALTLE